VGGEDYALLAIFKHDSWAATALYGNGERRITCKFNRVQPILLLPMGWLGRMLARREAWFLDVLKDLELVPDALGPVIVDGQVARNAVARAYVEGEPFRDRTGIAPDFIRQLEGLLGEMHRRGIAYVDLHKRENVIVDRQGRPNLIDFQVSLAVLGRFPFNTRPFRWLVGQMQEADLYHVRKHHVRLFKDEFTPDERKSYAQPPGLIGAHRRIAGPLRHFRRKLLTKLRIRDASGAAGSEHEPEVAFRRQKAAPGATDPADNGMR
jgi:hypothetical protein